MMLPNVKDTISLAFVTTVASSSLSLTRREMRCGVMRFKSYLVLLKPKTSKVSTNNSKTSWTSILMLLLSKQLFPHRLHRRFCLPKPFPKLVAPDICVLFFLFPSKVCRNVICKFGSRSLFSAETA